MNNSKYNKSLPLPSILTVLLFMGISLSSNSLASDISQNLRNNSQEAAITDNYLEIGVMSILRDDATFKGSDGKASNSQTGLIINGSYTWNNLFIENYSESGHGLGLGYSAFNNDDWILDLMITTDWGQFSFENNGRYYSDKDEVSIGARLSGYVGNNILQFAINQDTTGDHNGTTLSALIGRNWQLRNWNFHGIIGVEYASAKLNDYYVGISEDSASSTRFDAYEPGDSVSFSTEFGVTYPITQDWVFRATARAVTIPDEITDSPRFPNMDSVAMSFRTSLSYVF